MSADTLCDISTITVFSLEFDSIFIITLTEFFWVCKVFTKEQFCCQEMPMGPIGNGAFKIALLIAMYMFQLRHILKYAVCYFL